MENEHVESEPCVIESNDQPARDWAARGISWLGKCGGLAAGYSAYAAQKTGSMFEAVGRVSVQALGASGGAKRVIFMRTSDLLKPISTVSGEHRVQERVRLLQQDLSRLLREKEAAILAVLRRKGDAWRGKAEVVQVEDTIRQHEAEIARLSEELKTLQAQREAQRISEDAKSEAESPAAQPATQREPIAIVQEGEGASLEQETATPESFEPTVLTEPIESTDALDPVVEPIAASTTDNAPVGAAGQVIAEDAESSAELRSVAIPEVGTLEEGPGVVEQVQPEEAPMPVEQLEPVAESAPAEVVAATEEPGAAEQPELAAETAPSQEQVSPVPAEEPRDVERTPSSRPRRLSSEEVAEQAKFALASEKMAFMGVVRGVESTGYLSESAAKKLIAIANPAVDRLFTVLAEHPHEATRARSVGALAERQAKEGLPVLERAAADDSARVRVAALSGIYKLGGEKAIPHLTRALKDREPSVRHRAVMCLGWTGSPDVVPKLHRMMKDDDVSVRRAVVSALGTLKSKGSIPHVIAALDDEDVKVREAAHRTLKELSHRNIPFDPQGTLEERDKIKAQWKVWWREQGASAENG